MDILTAKRVWTSHGWLDNASVEIEGGVIVSVSGGVSGLCDLPLIVPGYIEEHVHGGEFYSVHDPDRGHAENWLRREASHGVCAMLASPSTAPVEDMKRSVAMFADFIKNPVKDGTRVLGVHIEGPFINPKRKGGMDADCILSPTVENYKKIAGEYEDAVRLVTLAPEIEGADELITYLVKRGVKVSAGHSDATAKEMFHAISLGLDGVTHFFNAARPIHHREPGLLTAALITPDVYCEMIGDLVHLAPETIKLLVLTAGADRICAITDAVQLTGVADGVYDDIHIINGSPQMSDGTLTGSRYLMDRVVQSLISIGLEPYDVFKMASNTPARHLGFTDFGDIAPKYRACLTALDETYNVMGTVLDGNININQ